MKLKDAKELANFNDGYEIWTPEAFYHFDTVKEAYLWYLDNLATKGDFEWQKECGKDKTLEDTKKRMRGFADDNYTVQCQFDNVFNEKHHIYKVTKRADGQVIRTGIVD